MEPENREVMKKLKPKNVHVVDGVKPVQVWENLVALPQESERI